MEQIDYQPDETFKMEGNVNSSHCSTVIRSIEFKHTWDIGQFSVHQEISSPGDNVLGTPFGDGEHEFVLKLFPAGKDEECSGYLSVFLQITKCPQTKLQFRVNFIIQTLDGPRGCALNKSVVTINRGGIVTASKFFSLEQLRSRSQRMIPEDTLTIECDMIVYGEYCSTDPRFQLDPDGNELTSSPDKDTTPPSTSSRYSLAALTDISMINEANMEELLDTGNFSDFVLKVDGKVFQLHRAVLATRSKYFQAMLREGTDEFKRSEVVIKEISGEVMGKVIHYMYSLKVPEVDDDTTDIIYAADMLMIDGLKTRLVSSLCKNITAENVCQRLEVGDKLCEDRLFQKAVVFFARNRSTITDSEEWKRLREQNPSLVARVVESGWDLIDNPLTKRRRTAQ